MEPVFQELLDGEVGPQAFGEIPEDVVLLWVDHTCVENTSLALSPEVLFSLEKVTAATCLSHLYKLLSQKYWRCLVLDIQLAF